MVDTCLIAIKFDKIISNLLKNETARLALSNIDLSYIWGGYVLKNVQDKLIIHYAYCTVKLALIKLFPQVLQGHHHFNICATFISHVGQKVDKHLESIGLHWYIGLLFFMFAQQCILCHVTWILVSAVPGCYQSLYSLTT